MQTDIKQETMSNWNCVVNELLEKEKKPIEFGKYASQLYHKTPRQMLFTLTYYKFAAKLIGSHKKVLDVGCSEGLGSWVLAKECGFCHGIDIDQEAIRIAKKNFSDSSIQFDCEDFFDTQTRNWDAVVNFDVVENIYPEHRKSFFQTVVKNLTDTGIALIGTPSEIGQQIMSPGPAKRYANIYSHTRLEAEMKEFFDFVFLFSAHDEVIHTGSLPLAPYFIALGCKPKKRRS